MSERFEEIQRAFTRIQNLKAEQNTLFAVLNSKKLWFRGDSNISMLFVDISDKKEIRDIAETWVKGEIENYQREIDKLKEEVVYSGSSSNAR